MTTLTTFANVVMAAVIPFAAAVAAIAGLGAY
jgi:hypothetical protein